jgi:outer membrane lipoprotein SlyB
MCSSIFAFKETQVQQKSKNSLAIWTGTVLGGVGGWIGSSRLASMYTAPLGIWGVIAGSLLGAVAGATLTKLVVDDPGAISYTEME